MAYPPPTPFPTSATNASIDKVIFQIERLSGQINELSGNVGDAADEVAARGKETVERLKYNFNQDTITQVDQMLDVIKYKTHDWPLTPLIVVGITAAILVVVTLIFFLVKGTAKVVEMRTQKRIRLASHDIESL